jgi:hypothetical protein
MAHFVKNPFYTSHSRGNLVDGLPHGVSWSFEIPASIDKNLQVFQRFCVICDIDLLGNFEKPVEGHRDLPESIANSQNGLLRRKIYRFRMRV